VRTLNLVVLGAWLLAACSPAAHIDKSQDFTAVPATETILVLPVESIMCPADASEAFFDHLVDQLNQRGAADGYTFAILKQDPASLPEQVLAHRVYASAEIYGCLEEVGCCTGEVTMTMRVDLFQPGISTPTLSLRYPSERFFDLERTPSAEARTLLARKTAERAAADLIDALRGGN